MMLVVTFYSKQVAAHDAPVSGERVGVLGSAVVPPCFDNLRQSQLDQVLDGLGRDGGAAPGFEQAAFAECVEGHVIFLSFSRHKTAHECDPATLRFGLTFRHIKRTPNNIRTNSEF